LVQPAIRSSEKGHIDDIMSNGQKVQSQNGQNGFDLYKVAASNPHINSTHDVLWFLDGGEEILWEQLLIKKGVIDNFERIIGDHQEGQFGHEQVIGINIGHPAQFGETPLIPQEESINFQDKEGLQSIAGVHVHLIPLPKEVKGLKKFPKEGNLPMYYKRYDFAGEATTRYFDLAINELDARLQFEKGEFEIGEYKRTVLEFDNLSSAIDAAVSLQYMVAESWKDVIPAEIHEEIKDLGLDQQEFLDYGKQLKTPGMLLAKKGKGKWILVPFSAGISAAELFGGYALTRNDYTLA